MYVSHICMYVCVCISLFRAMESTILASPYRVWNTGTIRQVESRPHIYMHAYIHIYACILICMHTYKHTYKHTYIHTCRPSICGIASRSMSFFWFAQNPKTFRPAAPASSTFEIQCKGNGRVGYPLLHTYSTYIHSNPYIHTCIHLQLCTYSCMHIISCYLAFLT